MFFVTAIALVVQRIGHGIADPVIEVRFLSRAQQSRRHKYSNIVLFMWQEQYERILRGLQQLRSIYAQTYSKNDLKGLQIWNGGGSYQDTRDAVVHFFQDCFHLKDWLVNSGVLTHEERTRIFSGEDPTKIGLPICRDIANAYKHLVLDKQVSFDQTLRLSTTGTAHVIPSETTFSLRFSVETDTGRLEDALELANLCVKEWDDVLGNLTPPTQKS